MKRRTLTVALLLGGGLCFGAATSVSSQEPVRDVQDVAKPAQEVDTLPPDRPAPAMGRPNANDTEFLRMADRLGLEGAQRDQFLADHYDFTAKVRRIAPRTRRLRQEFFRQLSAEEVDEEAVKRVTQQLGAANVMLERSLAELVLATRRHLTPPQQRMYMRFVQSRMQRIQEFMRRGGPSVGPGGPAARRQQMRRQQMRERRLREQQAEEPPP